MIKADGMVIRRLEKFWGKKCHIVKGDPTK